MSSLHLPSQLLVPIVDTDHLIPPNFLTPFYYTSRPRWCPYMSDKSLALLAPIIAHWFLILLYRMFLHSSEGDRHTLKRQAVRLMAEIQIVQTLFGWVWLTRFGNKEGPRDPAGEMQVVGRLFGSILPSLVGKEHAQEFLNRHGENLIQFGYWWAIPVTRHFLASFTIDAWHSFLRFLDIDRYLYPDVHAFLFDTIGVCVAYSLSGITHRESVILFVFSTLQTLGQCSCNTTSRGTVPRFSLHSSVALKEASIKPVDHGSVLFVGFPRRLRQLTQRTVLAVEASFVEFRMIQRAIQATRSQRSSSQSHTQRQLQLNHSDASN